MTRIFLTFALVVFISCKSDKRYHDDNSNAEKGATIAEGTPGTWSEEVKVLRADKDDLFRDPARSPLSESEREAFKGLKYFTPDSAYKVNARLKVGAVPEVISMETTTGDIMVQEVYGILLFSLKNKTYRLQVYRDPELQLDPEYKDYLFLPFSDLTNGDLTYGGGRYLDLRIPEGDSLTLDFNKAYSPYCAYNEKYSCPLVPEENKLSTAIRAGEKVYP